MSRIGVFGDPFSAEASQTISLPGAEVPETGRLKRNVPRVPLPDVAVTVTAPELVDAVISLARKVASKTFAVPVTTTRPETVSNGAGLSTKIGGVTDS